jgi:FtsP/CotA-like multicopper oxidase with cupredoxin domain
MRFLGLFLTFAICLMPVRSSAVQLPGTAVVYNLYATDGYYELPDGQPLHFYGLIGGRGGADFTYQASCTPGSRHPATGLAACAGSTNVTVAGGPMAPQGGPWVGQDARYAGNAQFPAPILYASVGDVVEVRLKNLGPAVTTAEQGSPQSIHFHALDIGAANSGALAATWDAVQANLCADGTTAGPGGCGLVGPAHEAGNVQVYMFTPSHAGTYLYYCHQDAATATGHLPSAMFGALVVYDPGDAAAAAGPGRGLGGTLYGLEYDKDHILLLSEFDLTGQGARQGSQQANLRDPRPHLWESGDSHFWFINGLSFPQTIHAAFPSGYSFAQWIAAHPGYDPLITGSESTTDAGSGPDAQQVLIRALNVSLETLTMRMDGYRGEVIGSDQRGWFWTSNVPSGQSREQNMLAIGSGQTYDWLVDFGRQGSNQAPGTATTGDAANGATPAQAGPLYFPFYNVDGDKTTNNGISPGGMLTFLVPRP